MSAAAVVIVTHNSEAEIGPCLDAALATGAEIVVVDNASSDRTVEQVRGRAPLIANPRNLGFAAAVNQGVRATRADCILLLNPDAVLQKSLDPLLAACAREKAGGAAGKLIDSEGRAQAGFNLRSLPTPW